MKKFVLLIALAGCTSAEECRQLCMPNAVRSHQMGECYCETPSKAEPYVYAHERFCHTCKENCGAAGMKTCKFGNDTWGAGPNVCECNEKPDAGR